MNDAQEIAPHIRLARADDDEFIPSLVPRLTAFDLPRWRKRSETSAGIRDDIARHLRELPPASHLYVAENEDGERLGFLHLQTQKDFFTGVLNCHISDVVVAPEQDGKGTGSALLTANLQATIRGSLEFAGEPAKLIARANRLFCQSTAPEH